MKTKKTLVLFFGLIISMSSFSQFSAGLEVASAMSNSSEIGNTGLGGSIRYEAPIKNKLSWTCAVGYVSFERFQEVFLSSNSIILVSNGVKYYFSEPSSGFYAAADIGMSGSRSNFSPGIGHRTNRWDLTGRYNVIHDANFLSLRVAYVLNRK